MAAGIALGVWRVVDRSRRHRLIDSATLVVLVVVFATGGEAIAKILHPCPFNWTVWALLAASAVLLVAALRFYVSYVYFANQFANAVWRNFAASTAD